MRLSTIRDRVRSLTGIRLQSLRSDAEIDAVINQAYQELISLTAWPFLRAESTVSVNSGDNEFSTPEEFTEVTSVSYVAADENQVRMRNTSLDELDFLDDESGDPVYYARVNDRDFKIWPRPDTSISFIVRGKSAVPNMIAHSDEPVFAEQFHPVIAYRAASMILGEEGDDSGRSQFYQNEAGNFFTRMRQYYVRSGDAGMIRMSSDRRRFLDANRGRPAGRL